MSYYQLQHLAYCYDECRRLAARMEEDQKNQARDLERLRKVGIVHHSLHIIDTF
jgi:hypothetical protein